MTFEEVVVELRGKFPKAEVSSDATRGETARRAAKLNFKRDKGDVYAGKDTDGTEVVVYYNDTADRICCTEIEPDTDDE